MGRAMKASRLIPMSVTVGALLALIVPATAAATMNAGPASWDWGNVDRYQQSYQQNFQFFNTEPGQVTPSTGLSGSDAGSFVITSDGCNGATVNPGGSCSLNVHVNPQSTGPLAASLDVDDGNGVVAVPLSATAMTGTLDINPNPIDFNPEPWFYGGQNYNVNVQALNYGVHISGVQITGPDQALFSINYGNCDGNTLPGWNGCSVGVGFNPTGPTGPVSANLVFTSDGAGSPQSIPISAEALAGPDPQFSPSSKDFGAVTVGSTSAAQTLTMTNAGDAPAQVQQAFIVSGTPQSFPISNDSCTNQVVAPGDTCTLDVAFSPANAGLKEASVFVITNGPAPVTQVSLSGHGYAAPGVAATVAGTPEVGRTLECNPVNANGDLSYQWRRGGVPIGGADDSSYELVEADFGAAMSCRITATNPVGSVSAVSPSTAPVAARNLANESHSLVDETSCRVAAVAPINKVKVTGTNPATPDSPLTFKARKRIALNLGGEQRSGKQIRFTPRQLTGFADGPVPLNVNGNSVQAALAGCRLSGSVSGGPGRSSTFALSGSTGLASGSIKVPKLKIRTGRAAGQVRVFAHGRPDTRFPLSGRKTDYNGISVRLSRRSVSVRGLLGQTSAVEVELTRGVVRGRGGTARAEASLQGQGKAKAAFKTAWRR